MKRICFSLGMVVFFGAGILLIHADHPKFSSAAKSNERPPSTHAAQSSNPPEQRLVSKLAEQALRFEANSGQTDSRVNYMARGDGYTLFLAGNEAVMKLRRGPALENPRVARQFESEDGAAGVQYAKLHTDSVVRLDLVGANTQAQPQGEEMLAGRTNYFVGKDPAKWRSNVAGYARVRYANIYPGVDLVYYGKQGSLEYDFDLAPGANPDGIRLKLSGAENTEISATGDLLVHVDGGDLRLHAPTIYQTKDGRRAIVDGGFTLLAKNEAGFRVGMYDREMPLVIDPTLNWSSYLGGSGRDLPFGIAVSQTTGNVYICGNTASNDFPTSTDAYQTGRAGGYDAFVSEFSSDGTTLVYSTYLGGSKNDVADSLIVDGSNNVYITGQTISTDFPTTPTSLEPTFPSGGEVIGFVTELNSSGGLAYSTYLGGTWETYGWYITLDSSNNIYVTGTTSSGNFPVKNPLIKHFQGGQDAFVTEITPHGNGAGDLLYSTYLGGSGIDYGYGLAVDSTGAIYVAGETNSKNFPVVNAYQSNNGATYDIGFITKIAPGGQSAVYSTYLGGTRTQGIQGLALDSNDNVYVTGYTRSPNFPVTNKTWLHRPSDAFVTELAADGQSLLFSTFLGGNGRDNGWGVVVDTNGNIDVSGYTVSTNFPLQDPYQNKFGGGLIYGDAFITVYSPAYSIVYSTYLGGADDDGAFGIALDSSNNIYVMGRTYSSDFPTQNALYPTYGGAGDAWVAKFSAPTANERAETSK
jgi:hypothetical protein